MQRRFLLAVAFPLAVSLAACSGDSTSLPDAARADGPAAADAPLPDAPPDSAGVVRNDAAPLPDAPVQRDTTASADLRVPDLAADNPRAPDLAADNVPAPDLASDNRPAPDRSADQSPADGPAGEMPTGDRPAADGRADGRGADQLSTDGADRDATADAGCAGWTTLERLEPADAKALIETSDPIVINVHYPYEGDIPGTDETIPFDDVDAIEAYLGHDHCADLLLVCKSGGMSVSAGNELIKRGYLRVRHLEGGMVAWVAAGYALLKDGGL